MKKLILIGLITILAISAWAQAPTNRIRARYRISQEKLNQINGRGFYITDGISSSLKICKATKLKVLITASGGILTIDPWKIKYDPAIPNSDPCRDDASTINSATENKLIMSLKRTKVGDATRSINIPYGAWLLGINAVALKMRPKVEDFKGNLWSANAVGGNFSLGPSIGYSFGYTKFNHRTATSWSATPSLSIGFSTVSLSKEPLNKEVVTSFTPSNFVLSPSVNLILARNDLGITLCYGKDAMMGRHKTAWAYQGKSFFGIGIAAGLKL